MTRTERLALAREITDRARASRGDGVLAVGLYGSTARGADGPCSDIEILCVLGTSGEDYSHEWTTGPWKAEVNFVSRDRLFAQAAEVNGDWPLTHGAYVHTCPLHDPEGIFVQLRRIVRGQPGEKFTAALRMLIVGDIYELVGKIRNAQHLGYSAGLPMLAMHLALYGAYLIGLADRHLYTSGTRLFEESLRIHGRPAGYDDLCRLVMEGTLSRPTQVVEACEAFWAGVERWSAARGILLEEPRRVPF
ncbi:MAG: kanamycin nucleotidyltransferase C-terminal domain-containing protein [Candidatus Bipolaricaulota bacterium]